MSETTIMHVLVRVAIEHSGERSDDDVAEEVQSSMDYNMVYNHNGLRIKDTEIIEVEAQTP